MHVPRGILLALAVLAGCGGDDDPRLSETQAHETLGDYLTAVHEGDYAAAAPLLARGGGPIEDRPDLQPLGLENVTVESVTEGLTRYCQPGCAAATFSQITGPDDDGYTLTVSFGEPRGHPLNRTLRVWATTDGQPYVRGLPPAGDGQIPPS